MSISRDLRFATAYSSRDPNGVPVLLVHRLDLALDLVVRSMAEVLTAVGEKFEVRGVGLTVDCLHLLRILDEDDTVSERSVPVTDYGADKGPDRGDGRPYEQEAAGGNDSGCVHDRRRDVANPAPVDDRVSRSLCELSFIPSAHGQS